MDDWLEWAKVIGGVLGAGTLATAAKLYHDRVVAGKNTELLIKQAEIARISADLAKAEARARNSGADTTPEQRDLGRLREQLTELVEKLAESMQAQAATLYRSFRREMTVWTIPAALRSSRSTTSIPRRRRRFSRCAGGDLDHRR